MRTINYILIIFLTFYITVFSQKREINFYNNAKKLKTIKFDDSLVIGDITYLDTDINNNILVTDMLSKKVYLFNSDGGLIKTLSTEKCTPGFNWQPYKAMFDRKGNIVVLNSAPWGYRFNADGNCFGDMDISFIAPAHLAFLENGSMVGYYNYGDGNHLKYMDNTGKEKFRFGKFPKDFERLIYRFEGGGLITDNNDNIYQVNVSSPLVTKYDKKGNFIKEFMNKPSYLRIIEKDLSNNDPVNALKEVPKLLENKTTTTALFLYENNKILVLLSHSKYFGIELYNTDGKYLLNKELILDKKILAAKNGYIYLLLQPPPDKQGNLPNPVVEVYKLQSNK